MNMDTETDGESHPDNIIVRVADISDGRYAQEIVDEMEASARVRGTGISKRSPAAIVQKMMEGKAVIATTTEGAWVGFSYVEIWSDGEFVSNSGLIVNPAYRGQGMASTIKKEVFKLSREKYPQAKIFSITTSMAIMKLNTSLGFEPVTFESVTREDKFWKGCESCVNYNILLGKQCKNCLCTAMLFTLGGKMAKLELS